MGAEVGNFLRPLVSTICSPSTSFPGTAGRGECVIMRPHCFRACCQGHEWEYTDVMAHENQERRRGRDRRTHLHPPLAWFVSSLSQFHTPVEQ